MATESPKRQKLGARSCDMCVELKAKMSEMQEELDELRAYKQQKEAENDSSQNDDDDDNITSSNYKYNFGCCEHIDESENSRQLYSCPSADVYCTACECKEPCSYGDFEVVGEYWWRCPDCCWQNGLQFELLCGECVERRINPPKCQYCGQSEKDVGKLTDYKDRGELCKECLEDAIEEDTPKCESCCDKEEAVGQLVEYGNCGLLCAACTKEAKEEEAEEEKKKANGNKD